jgi:hypothetical protein
VRELESLDPDEILKTARQLRSRIVERFPSSGLVDVSEQLIELAFRARRTCVELRRPNRRLRIVSYATIAIVVLASIAALLAALSAAESTGGVSWAEIIQAADAAVQDLVLLGAAIYFFVSFETRVKRGKIVRALHQLRTLAHLIDVHQLTKSPDMVGHAEQRTKSSPKPQLPPFLLGRYLDYCSEMLSLTGKIAALYGGEFDDAVSQEAITEIEELTIGLQSKIWQKIVLLRTPPIHDEPRRSEPSAEAIEAQGSGEDAA